MYFVFFVGLISFSFYRPPTQRMQSRRKCVITHFAPGTGPRPGPEPWPGPEARAWARAQAWVRASGPHPGAKCITTHFLRYWIFWAEKVRRNSFLDKAMPSVSGPEHRASGPDFDRILVGSTYTSALRPAFGWPEGHFAAFPVRIWPRSGPEGRCPVRPH